MSSFFALAAVYAAPGAASGVALFSLLALPFVGMALSNGPPRRSKSGGALPLAIYLLRRLIADQKNVPMADLVNATGRSTRSIGLNLGEGAHGVGMDAWYSNQEIYACPENVEKLLDEIDKKPTVAAQFYANVGMNRQQIQTLAAGWPNGAACQAAATKAKSTHQATAKASRDPLADPAVMNAFAAPLVPVIAVVQAPKFEPSEEDRELHDQLDAINAEEGGVE